MSRNPSEKHTKSYCFCITRKRLLSLWLALLLLFVAAALGVYSWMELGADRTSWEYMDYFKMAVGWGGGILFFLLGVGTAYTALRDALCPSRSALAKSIRSQLPNPKEPQDVRELFAMVDRDIEENGLWFDRVAVGKEWVLGEQASYIPRIRVFFGRDEIRSRRSGEQVNTTRILELHILDERRQHQVASLRKPRELQALLDCISLRAPDALRRPYSEYQAWCRKSDMEWEDMLREYRVKQGEREMAGFQLGQDAPVDQGMTLVGPDGSATSRVTPDLIRKTLMECLEQGEGTFSLIPGHPPQQAGADAIRFEELSCCAGFYEDLEEPSRQELEELGVAELFVKITQQAGEDVILSGRECVMDIPGAEEILIAWFRGAVPSFKGWDAVPLSRERKPEKKRELLPPRLGLMSAAGVFQSHERFTREDIEAAAEGLVDGTYQMVDLTLRGGYLWMQVQGGDKQDGRCRVSVTRADSDKLRFFRKLCSHSQAAAWLLEFADGRFRPDWKDWKDYTRQAEREMHNKK